MGHGKTQRSWTLAKAKETSHSKQFITEKLMGGGDIYRGSRPPLWTTSCQAHMLIWIEYDKFM